MNDSQHLTAEVEFANFAKDVKMIRSDESYTLVLTQDDELYYCGNKNSLEVTNTQLTKYHKKLPTEKIRNIYADCNTIIILTEDDKIYFEGIFTKKDRPNEETEKVISLGVGRNCHMYVTDNGKLYGAGLSLLEMIDSYYEGAQYIPIALPENVVPKKVECGRYGGYNTCAVLLVEIEEKPQLWSAGLHPNGLLGQGDGVTEFREFKVMTYDTENIVIKDFTLGYDHGLAITAEGQLYGWGKNDHKQLGLADTKNYFELVKIEYFANYTVHEISAGKNHSLIKASPIDDKDKTMFFLVGNELHLVIEGRTEEGVLHLTEYDNTTATTYINGPSNIVFVFDGQEDPSANVGIHHGYTCDVTKKTPIEGTMHFYKSDKEWHFLSKEGYEEAKDTLPSVCYATKYYVEDIQGKEWPQFDSNDILEETKEHCEPTYRAILNVDGEIVVPNPKTNEDGIFEKEYDDINPLIYYRVARPIKDGKSLPALKLENYHKKTELFGIKVEADPDYSFMKNDIMMALEFEKYLDIQDRIKLFDSKYDEELLKKIEENLIMMGQDFIECPYVFMMAGEIEFENPGLRALPTESVQSRIDSLVMLNQYLLKSLPFLYFEEGLIHEDSKGETVLQTESLTACFILGKKFALDSINTSYLTKVSDGLPTDFSTPSIEIDTSKIKKWYSENECDTKGDHTMFGHLFKKLKEKNFENLRLEKSYNHGWMMNFSNECKQDDGTFRKCVSQIVEELQSSYLPLFIPSINNKDKDGEFQDAWVINPS
jgi:hypothetical protein